MKSYVAPQMGSYRSCLDHGTFVDLSLFKNHPTRSSVAQQIVDSRKNLNPNEHQRKLSCPSCRNQPMKSTFFPAEPNGLYIDQCFKCDSIWFDHDEMRKVFFGKQVKTEPITEMQLPTQTTIKEATWTPDTLNPFYYLGFPVETHHTQTHYRQLMAYLLLFVVLLVSWKGFRSETFFHEWMFYPTNYLRHYGMTFISSIFLHGSWFHLLGNMYFMLICADNIEEKKGPFFVLELFLAAGIAGKVAYILSGGIRPSIGASGAISGLLVYYAFKFPHARFQSRLRSWRWGISKSKEESIGFYMLIWVILQLIGIGVPGSSTNYAAHLGGAVMGFLFYVFTEHSNKKT